ncbi:tripartite tricarboxylate transporter TctB family protein [Oleispirillum naphthae]|uniref:tripartite tricarboxylate transporter TctB family protein n=1 Tax=Oleispirillum naphthae TaxID=2838853 RepID=UPI0030822CAD
MTKNRTAGILAVVLGVFYLAGAFAVPVFDAGDQVGPRAFPFLIAALVIGCGAALLVRDFRSAERKPFSWGFAVDRVVWGRILLTMAAGIAYGLVLDDLGYLIATFLFMILVSSLINVGRHVQNLTIAVLFSVVTFVSFALILKLSLPRGILGAVLPF